MGYGYIRLKRSLLIQTALIHIHAPESGLQRSTCHHYLAVQLPHRRRLDQPHSLSEGEAAGARHCCGVLHELAVQRVPAQFQVRSLVGTQLVVV